MRHTVVITKVLVGVFTLLGTLPVAADEPTMEKRYRDEAKFKKRFELERAADRASRDSQILRQQEIVHIVPKEPLMSQYLNSEPGRSEPGDNKKWMAQLAEEDKGLTVRQAMERRLARFEAALEEARKYRKNLPMNAEGAKERVALEGRIDSKINYEAFKNATSRAVAEYEAFDHYKSRVQSEFQAALGDIYRVPGETRVLMNDRFQSMAAFFKSYSTGYIDPLPDAEKTFQKVSEIEHRLKRNAHGGTSRMSTVLSQQLATMESAEKNGVRVFVGNMHVAARTDSLQYDQKIALKFQSALRSAKELRAKTGGTGPVAVFVTAATVFSSTAALAGEAEPASPEVSGEVAAEFSRDWARPQARRTSR